MKDDERNTPCSSEFELTSTEMFLLGLRSGGGSLAAPPGASGISFGSRNDSTGLLIQGRHTRTLLRT